MKKRIGKSILIFWLHLIYVKLHINSLEKGMNQMLPALLENAIQILAETVYVHFTLMPMGKA